MSEILTKENFWDGMSEKYPKAMKHFGGWIDRYKDQNNGYYYALFNAGITTHLDSDTKQPVKTIAPKYHELPIAMQFGIFLEYYFTTIKDLFPGASLINSPDVPGVAIQECLLAMEYWFKRGVLK